MDFLLGTSKDESQTKVDAATAAQAEFDAYTRGPSLDNEVDPMNYTLPGYIHFPVMSKLAQKFLTIPIPHYHQFPHSEYFPLLGILSTVKEVFYF